MRKSKNDEFRSVSHVGTEMTENKNSSALVILDYDPEPRGPDKTRSCNQKRRRRLNEWKDQLMSACTKIKPLIILLSSRAVIKAAIKTTSDISCSKLMFNASLCTYDSADLKLSETFICFIWLVLNTIVSC